MVAWANYLVLLREADAEKWSTILEHYSVGDQLSDYRVNDDAQDTPDYALQRVIRQVQRRFSDDEVAELVRRYQAGETTYQLAAAYSANRQTISKKLRAAGLELRKDSPAPEQIDEMVRLHESGLSPAQVGEQIGRSTWTVLRYLRKRGVAV